jgi:WD40 repeat protein
MPRGPVERLVRLKYLECPFLPALSPNGKWIASVRWGGTVQLWDASTLKELRNWPGASYRVTALAFSGDGKLLASAADGIIRLWDTGTGTRRNPLEEQEQAVSRVAFARRGELLVAVAGNVLHLWDARTGKLVRELTDKGTIGRLIAVSPDEKLLAAADEGISIWDLRTGKLLQRPRMPHCRVQAFGFSRADRLTFAVEHVTDEFSAQHWIVHWDVTGGKEALRLSLGVEGEWSRHLAFRALSPNS